MTENRPWGFYKVLHEGPDYKIKLLHIEPRKRISYQKHKHRSEHWFVASGCPLVTLDGAIEVLYPGSSINVPIGTPHRLEAGDLPVEIIEVQTGTYFGEDDIIRIEDDYGRN